MRNIVILALFTLGGVSALIYEVLWMRSFRLVFGSSSQSAAAVLAAYFAGLAIGNLLGARLARRGGVVRLYGWAEITVGLTALLVAPWLMLFETAYPTIHEWSGGNIGWLTLARLLLSLAALAPPTIAMGVTLPLLSQAMVTRGDHVARRTALLYGLNVAGATAGAVLAGFVLPESLGIRNSVYVAVGLNQLVGAAALLLGDASEDPVEDAVAATPAPALSSVGGPLLLVAALAAISGFGSLALEVMYVRILSYLTEGSVYSFGLMLVTFLLCLAAGSAVVSRWLDRGQPWRFLGWTQLAAAVGIAISPLAFGILMGLSVSEGDTLATRLPKLFLASLAAFGAPIFLAGMVLPCTWRIAATGAADVAAQVGRLTSINTLAAVGGSLAAGFVLLPSIGLSASLLAIAVLYAIAATAGFARGYRGLARAALCLLGPALLGGMVLAGPWDFSRQPLDEDETLLSYADGESATVAVIEDRAGTRVMKVNHTYTLGSTAGAIREVGQERLPLLLHPRPDRVAFIGVATGMTLSAALDFPVERVVAIELLPGVAESVSLFEQANRSVCLDPRVELVVADGRNYLRATREEFDVIISDLFIPWHAGTGDLYSVEHFSDVRRRLAEGGIFAQWLPGYQLTVDELRSIAASLAEVFPAVTLWRNDFDVDQPILCLLGHRDAEALDPETVDAACKRLAAGSGPPAPFLMNAAGVTMLYVAGDKAVRQWAAGAPLNTDDRPYIEFHSPGSFFEHRQKRTMPVLDCLAEFRPRAWNYAEPLAKDRPIERLFRAADLMHDAEVARAENNFEAEFRGLKELVPLAGDVPGVTEHIVRVAMRYRTRNAARSEELLSAVTEFKDTPVGALLMLADARRNEGQTDAAIVLLERAVDAAPQIPALRRPLHELLKSQDQFERAEMHLRKLLEAVPNDPFARLDLAHALHRQGKTAEAGKEIDAFRVQSYKEDRKTMWRYLRSLGLGSYVDQPPP